MEVLLFTRKSPGETQISVRLTLFAVCYFGQSGKTASSAPPNQYS